MTVLLGIIYMLALFGLVLLGVIVFATGGSSSSTGGSARDEAETERRVQEGLDEIRRIGEETRDSIVREALRRASRPVPGNRREP